jgi:putative two-component system response regulator
MAALGKARILIADGVPEHRDALVVMLGVDYDVAVAHDGPQALVAAQSPRPLDLILLDVAVPLLDGYEVCRRLKADCRMRAIPVIFLASASDDEEVLRGLDLGALDYIDRPYREPLVRARLANAIALCNQQRALETRVQERTRELHETRIAVIERLGRAAEYKDYETGLHVVRMSRYARLIALHAGVREDAAELLMLAAPMHDIGKIGIPDSILKKRGVLSEEEYRQMQMHTAFGGEIIGDHHSELLKLARSVAVAHHEKWDGSGYPHGLVGESIPWAARVVAIADVFDALTSDRPYKPAWPVAAAVDHIQARAGTDFDPALVESFIAAMPEMLAVRQNLAGD